MGPISTELGLERFGALRQLDMLSVCDEDAVHSALLSPGARRQALHPRITLWPAAVEQLAKLSGSLQKLRLAFVEDTQVDPACACMQYLLLFRCAPSNLFMMVWGLTCPVSWQPWTLSAFSGLTGPHRACHSLECKPATARCAAGAGKQPHRSVGVSCRNKHVCTAKGLSA